MVAPFRGFILFSAAAFLFAGCSFAEDALWPSVTGESPSGSGEQVVIPASQEEMRDEVMYADSSSASDTKPISQVYYEPERALNVSSPTGTFVGAKVAQQRSELEQLERQKRDHVQQRADDRGQLLRSRGADANDHRLSDESSQ